MSTLRVHDEFMNYTQHSTLCSTVQIAQTALHGINRWINY